MNSEDRNVISRFIHDFISWLKARLKGEKVSLKIVKLENRFAAVLRNVDNANTQKNNTTNDGDVQYSISYTTDNKPVVVVNDDIISNAINNKDKISIVKWYLGRFKKVPIKSQIISFIRDTKNEYTNSRYSQWLSRNNPQVFNDKMRVAGHPQDIIYATTNYINEGLKHQRKYNIIDFARGDIFLDVSGRKYAAKVVIGFTNKGVCELHDIVDIIPTNFEYKKIESASMLIDTNNVSSRSDAPSLEPTISQIDIESQEHYTQESENNSSPEQNNDGNSYSFEDIDVYDEAQYNDFGWVRYNDVLSASEYSTLLSRYADYKHNKHNYPTTRFGEAVIHSSELPDVIMYVKGSIVSPQITKAVRIETDSYTASSIKGWILQNEYRQVSQPYSAIESLYGQEVLSICRKRDYEPFWEYQARTKRNGSPTSDTISGTEQDGTGSTQQNKTTDKAGLDNSAFSMPENDIRYSFEDDVASLTEQRQNGEISESEYRNELQRLMNEATEKYGAIPKGENPAVDVTVPKQVSDKRNTRRKNNKKES